MEVSAIDWSHQYVFFTQFSFIFSENFFAKISFFASKNQNSVVLVEKSGFMEGVILVILKIVDSDGLSR